MGIKGLDRYESAGGLPATVRTALELARELRFKSVVHASWTPSAWPGSRDPEFRTTEVRLAPDLSTILATRMPG